ncbi:hypothetical protein [Cyprinid herpesvirus 3]|uniref:Uncharacterized protein n=1 Tax=Cyprinid herpesvirus 3 TaxID=180230 RepID=A3QMU4_CYHV3|nr:hypothetical protein [Cyprinid herpesvirus 3]
MKDTRVMAAAMVVVMVAATVEAIQPDKCIILWARSEFGSDCLTPCDDVDRGGYVCSVRSWSFLSWMGSKLGIQTEAYAYEPCAIHDIDPQPGYQYGTWVRCEPNNVGCVMRTVSRRRCRTEPAFGFSLYISVLRAGWSCQLDTPAFLDAPSPSGERPCALNGTHAVFTVDDAACSEFMGSKRCDSI